LSTEVDTAVGGHPRGGRQPRGSRSRRGWHAACS